MSGFLDPKTILDEHKTASWVERRVVRHALSMLEEGADPSELLTDLDAARGEIDAWIELEESFGIAEVMKLLAQWLATSWMGGEKTPAAEWTAKLSGTAIPEGPAADQRREVRRAADPVFNLWGRGLNANYGRPRIPNLDVSEVTP